MAKGDSRARRAAYVKRLRHCVETYKSILVVTLDNVGSKALQNVRRKLRGEAEILVGKNTAIRYFLREMLTDFPHLEPLIPLVRGNVAFVFTSSDLKLMCQRVSEDRVNAPAKSGAVSPLDVIVPAGNSGLDPSKTSFFQALGVPTKIVKGSIEITSNYPLIKAGAKVGASDAVLLNMLGISPFTFGVDVKHVFSEGSAFAPELLDVDDNTLAAKIQEGIRNVAALSLAIGLPTAASVPHSLVNAYKDLLAMAISTGVTFPLAEAVIDRINNPEAYASAAPAAASAAASAGAAAGAQAAAAVVEEESEEEDAGFDLFD